MDWLPELISCPFCGGPGYYKNHIKWNQHYIRCDKCGCSTKRVPTEYIAADLWNARTPPPSAAPASPERADLSVGGTGKQGAGSEE